MEPAKSRAPTPFPCELRTKNCELTADDSTAKYCRFARSCFPLAGVPLGAVEWNRLEAACSHAEMSS